jgi:hypothetical protein
MDGPSSTLATIRLRNWPGPDKYRRSSTRLAPTAVVVPQSRAGRGLEMTEIAAAVKRSIKAVKRVIRPGAAWLRSALSTPAQS